ncbi:MAG: alkaline phosphatase family protein [Acidobacteria bacterium]|nr:alkaline phosphatase family protein [Acidobacteriota bacterium]
MLHRVTAALAVSVLVGACCASMTAQPSGRKVVVISLDAFGAESLHDPQLPAPTLHRLMKMGAYATSMKPINPTVTWPNHTSMVSGVNASRHHVIVNGLIVNQRTDTPPKIEPHTPRAELVAVPTVYDAAHKAGLVTAEVDWVAIEKADGITWRFTEYSDPHGPIERDLVQQGAMTEEQLAHFNKPSQAWRDRIYTLAAVDIIKKHHPDLMLLHLLALDSIEHQTGYGNDSGRNTIAFLDDRVKDVIDAVREAGDLDRTTFLIVSDHGQMSVHKHLNANLLLRQSGLQGASSVNPTFAIPEGGYALLYQKHATEESTDALKALFAGKAGVRAALTPTEASKDGWPTPAETNQAPDLLLYAENGYAFSGNADQFAVDAKETGAHGYPNTEPLMKEIFIAAGAGIENKGEIAEFNNVDIAPTIARLLNISLTNVDGKPLTEILSAK